MELFGGYAGTLSYDCLNNLVSVSSYSGSHSFSYDAANQRIYKIEGGSAKTYYYRSGLDVLAEYDGNDYLKAEYIYGAEGVIAKRNPKTGIYFYFKDQLGSTRNL